jgi:hypothetical protein
MTVTLDYSPPNAAALLVFIDGVRQDTSAYTLSGTSLTFTGTVPSGTNNVQVVHLGLTQDVGVPSDDTISTAKIQDNAITTVKIQDDAVTSAKLANSLNITSGNSLTIDSGATITNNGTNGGGFGKVLQVVSTLKTDGYSTASATMADITGLNATITPSSTSSKILILSHIASGGPILIAYPFKLYRDSTAIAESTAGSGNNTYVGVRPGTSLQNFQITYLDSPSTTSSITYKWKTNGNGGTHSINVGSNTVYHGTSGITLLEIAG